MLRRPRAARPALGLVALQELPRVRADHVLPQDRQRQAVEVPELAVVTRTVVGGVELCSAV